MQLPSVPRLVLLCGKKLSSFNDKEWFNLASETINQRGTGYSRKGVKVFALLENSVIK